MAYDTVCTIAIVFIVLKSQLIPGPTLQMNGITGITLL